MRPVRSTNHLLLLIATNPPTMPPLSSSCASGGAVALLAATFFLTLSRDASTPASSPPSYGHRLPTLVDGATDKGAVCLDTIGCQDSGRDPKMAPPLGGSSAYMERRVEFVGILSDDESQNPEKTFLGEGICGASIMMLLVYRFMCSLNYLSQDLRKKFPHCSSDMEPGQYFFPREVAKASAPQCSFYDVWQVELVLSPEGSGPERLWHNCRLDITKCDSKQLEILQGFRKELLDAISEFKKKRDWGMFIDSCFIHSQSMNPLTWHSPSAPRINSKTIAGAVGDWFFNRREVKEIDWEYPCNPTCYNTVLNRPYKEE